MGEQDAIVPAENARLIADAILRAELELSPSAGIIAGRRTLPSGSAPA
jgi:hypothetical protein